MTAKNVRVEESDDYDQFVNLPGNRMVGAKHVKQLMKKMEAEGNLTQLFPIIVNERMEVIDGQHRLEALRQLGWPVFYEVKKGLTIDTVQALNTGVQNWTWFDYAWSFAQQGNEQYQRFLNMWEYLNLPFTLIQYYATNGAEAGHKSGKFSAGEFEFADQTECFKLLKQYKEISEAADHGTGQFARALFDVMRLPDYDHKRMVSKMSKFGSNLLKGYTNRTDYLRAIEDVYNTYVPEEAKARLF